MRISIGRFGTVIKSAKIGLHTYKLFSMFILFIGAESPQHKRISEGVLGGMVRFIRRDGTAIGRFGTVDNLQNRVILLGGLVRSIGSLG